MQFIRKQFKLLTVAAACAVIGAGIGVIASAGAATPSSGKNASTTAHGRLGGLHTFRRAVHGNVVVPTTSGFVTVSFDRGTIESINGQQLIVKAGTRRQTYKTVTLSIPTNARIRDNGQRASMADLRPGQRVLVVQDPKRWLVIARTPGTP